MRERLLIISLCILNFGSSSNVQAGTLVQNFVSVESPECTMSSQILYCDYKTSDKDTVHMGPLPRERIKQVFLYNIRSLSLDVMVSLNLSLYNVDQVKVEENPSSDCKQFELSAKITNFEKIPDCISSLYLENCRVNTIRLTSQLSKLDIHSSGINEFHMSEPLVDGITAVLQSSQIRHLKSFRSPIGSTFLMHNSTVDQIDSNGVDIKRICMKDSTIKAIVDGSSAVFSGGCLEISGFEGKFTVMTSPRNLGIHETTFESGEEPKEEKCKKCGKQTFVVLFSLCFISLVCSWLGFVAYLNKNKIRSLVVMFRSNQKRQSPEGLCENSTLMPGLESAVMNEKNTNVDDIGDKTETPEEVKESDDDSDFAERQCDEMAERIEKVEQEVKSIENNYDKTKLDFTSSIKMIYDKIDNSMNSEYGSKEGKQIKCKIHFLYNGYNYMNELWVLENSCKSTLQQIILKESITQNTKNCQVPLKMNFSKILDDVNRIFSYMRKSSLDSEQVINGYQKELKNSYLELWKNCKKTELALKHIAERTILAILNSQIDIQNIVFSRDKIHIQSLIEIINKKIHELKGR